MDDESFRMMVVLGLNLRMDLDTMVQSAQVIGTKRERH